MSKVFKMAIVGGRDFNDYDLLVSSSDAALANKVIDHEIVIICGGAKGADTLGAEYAEERGYAVEYYHADWGNLDVKPCVVKQGRYGKYNALAGHNRNQQMRDVSDGVLAFWDGKSRGTKEMIVKSKEQGIPVRTITWGN